MRKILGVMLIVVMVISMTGQAFAADNKSVAKPGRIKITNIVIPYYEYGKAKKIIENYGSTTIERYIWSVAAKNKYKGFRVSWSKVSRATGYQLYMREKGKKTWKNKGRYTGTAAKVSFNKMKEYEFKVRAYRSVKNKRIYGPWSAIKSYKFSWDRTDLKKYMENLVSDNGYQYADNGIDTETGTLAQYKATPENSSWSTAWPIYLNRYCSFEYASKFVLEKEMQQELREFRDALYCAYVVDAESYRGCFDNAGIHAEIGDRLPNYYEIFLLRI